MKILKPLFKITFAFIILFMVLMFTGYILNNGPDEVPATIEQDSLLPCIEVKGYKFHGETYGDPANQLVIILNGEVGGDYKYLLNLKSLSDQYFVAFYNRRGCGLSPRTAEGAYLGADTAIADIYAIAEHFKPRGKIILLGHGWGAMLASAFLSKFPDKVEKIILAEPDFLTSETAKMFFENTNGLRPEFSFSALKHLINSYFESSHVKEPDAYAGKDYFFSKLMYGKYKGHPLRKFYCNEEMFDNFPVWRSGAIASQYLMASVFNDDGSLKINFTKGLGTNKTPVLLIASECNKINGDNIQREHKLLFGNVQYEIMKNCGHYMMMENEGMFMEVALGFLNK